MKILLCCLMSIGLTFLLPSSHGSCAVIAGSSHFPASVGSSWNYNTQALTITGATTGMRSGTETVQVQAGGSFRSDLSLSNGNSVLSYTNYVNLGQAIYVTDTQITITTVDTVPLPVIGSYWTETTTVNTYTPSQLSFPSSVVTGTLETSTSTGNTHLTGVTHYTGIPDVQTPPTDTVTTQVVDVTVGPTESVTVPAGTFQAIKITKVFTITEGSTTNPPFTVFEWYAAGVGLVKMDAPTLKRELTSYNVIPVTTRLLTVTFQGTGGGSVHSSPSGISCSSGTTCAAAPFNSGEIVTLTAAADVNSTFTGWSGSGCSGTATCVVTMDAAKSVSAGFDPLPARVFILGSPTPYQLLQQAYDAAIDNDTLQPLAEVFTENPLTFRHAVDIILAGGYDAGFLNQTGFTTIQGQVVFQLGSVVVDRLAIR